MALPHIKNSTAGVNHYDPVHKSIFEVAFTLPEPLKNQFGSDQALITEHVLNVGGLDALYRAPEVDSQKFMGVDRSFIKPHLGETKATIEIEFSLNLRNKTDNYLLKLFRAWASLGYNMTDGTRMLKKDYCSGWFVVKIANREGDVYHQITFKDVMIAGNLEMDGGLDYESDDALKLKVKFVSDWWDEIIS